MCALVTSPDVALQREATRALANLTGNCAVHEAAMGDGAVSALTQAARCPDALAARFAAIALANLAHAPDNTPPFFVDDVERHSPGY